MYPFSLGDKIDVELEFVLIDTKRDQEKCIELSGDEDDEDNVDARIDGKCASGQKIGRIDDIEMNEFESDGFEAAQERKVFKVDSDGDVAPHSSQGNDGETTERKVFDVDNDEANRVKSEDSDSDFDSQSSDGEDKVELKFSTLPDSATDSESDSYSESVEDDPASKMQSSSEDDSKSDSGVESKIIKDEAML